MATTLHPQAADPLASLVNRIGDLLYRRAKEELAEGLPVPRLFPARLDGPT
jgi:hypothetical protein